MDTQTQEQQQQQQSPNAIIVGALVSYSFLDKSGKRTSRPALVTRTFPQVGTKPEDEDEKPDPNYQAGHPGVELEVFGSDVPSKIVHLAKEGTKPGTFQRL